MFDDKRKKYLCKGQYIQINFRNCRCKCPQMQIPTLSAMVSLQNINTFLSFCPIFHIFWQILHTSVTIFLMISSCPGGGCPPLDPDIHVDLCQLFTWPHSAFPRCDIITSAPSILGSIYITVKKNSSRSWLECIPPLWLGWWLLVRMNKFMRFSKAFPPTYTTGPPLSLTYSTYSSHSLTFNVVHCTTGTDRS